jgi:A/G-specific adenine glycosylase
MYGWLDENPKAQWAAAEKLVKGGEPRLVNQALMELGAKVCSFRNPRCLLCPIQSSCVAFKTGMQGRIPPVRKRPETIKVQLFAVVQKKGARYLMKSADGMWEFPTFAELPPGTLTKAGACRHTITHHRLDVRVYIGNLKENDGYQWKALSSVPISSLTRKILAAAERDDQ